MTESRLKIGSFRWPHCFGCSVSLPYKHNVTDLSEEQGDTMLASASQIEISGLALALFPNFCSLQGLFVGFLFVKQERLLPGLTRTALTSRKILANGAETTGVEETKE